MRLARSVLWHAGGFAIDVLAWCLLVVLLTLVLVWALLEDREWVPTRRRVRTRYVGGRVVEYGTGRPVPPAQTERRLP